MINLLPPSYKDDIMYARRNRVLLRWVVLSSIGLIGIGLIVAGGLLYIQQSINTYNKQIAVATQTLQVQKVSETQKRLDEISTNTKLVVQVLSREVLFSKLLRQIGAALPNNTALKSLQIDKLQGGVQLNASAADFNAGTQLQLNLQDPKNGVFDKADINSISCNTNATNDAAKLGLPCDVNLRALFSKNNAYVYITPPKQGAAKP